MEAHMAIKKDRWMVCWRAWPAGCFRQGRPIRRAQESFGGTTRKAPAL